MRAARLYRPGPITSGPLSVETLPDPSPATGEILVGVTACGVCRTDLQIVEGDLTARHLPITPGHQAVGRVVAVGPGEGIAGGDADQDAAMGREQGFELGRGGGIGTEHGGAGAGVHAGVIRRPAENITPESATGFIRIK